MARVRVPQAGGEIAIARDGDEPVVFRVGADGTTSVPDADLPTFLALIEGSAVEANPASENKE